MAAYIDLIDALGAEDRAKIENYIEAFGVNKQDFIGVENWLQSWSHSKQRLYKLMGNQFIREFDYSFEKDDETMRREVNDLMRMTFKESYHEFYWTVLKKMDLPEEVMKGFSKVTDVDNFINDKIVFPIKYKREGFRKALQLQAGMKPIRALSKIIDYFKDIYNFSGFEQFRLKHSMILNDRFVKGKVCISIHPLDFMTMSDNASNWSSCMSWKEEGCYHIGTVEMMNSNNVVCCYLKNEDDYCFMTDDQKKDYGNDGTMPLYTWNNKRWRQLCYVTKDIVMSGKPYPYKSEEMSKTLIALIKDLALENMGWTYSFGPELYQDMKHITYKEAIDRNRDWIRYGGAKKHNIIWDTKGMYNDMLNDTYTHYWCYRNKVKSNKLISVSGKAPCLCCGDTVLEDGDYDDDYNERFSNTGSVVCPSCTRNFTCEECDSSSPRDKHYIIYVNGQEVRVCSKCYERNAKICPDCGKPFWIGAAGNHSYHHQHNILGYYITDREGRFYPGDPRYGEDPDNGEPIWVCEDCKKLHKNDVEKIYMKEKWGNDKRYITIFKDGFDVEKYRYANLDSPKEFCDTLKGCGINQLDD